jgi:hypothetical protein
VEVNNRIDVSNDPVNWVDPLGLLSFNGGLGYGGTLAIGWGKFSIGFSLSLSINVADNGSVAAQLNITKFNEVYGVYAGHGINASIGTTDDCPSSGFNSSLYQEAEGGGAGWGIGADGSIVSGTDTKGGDFIGGSGGAGRMGTGYGVTTDQK